MDLNQFLLWMAGISCAAIIVRAGRTGVSGAPGWAAVAGAIEAVMAAAWWIRPQYAGFVGGSLWCALILVPLLAVIKLRQFLERQQFAKAAALSAWIRLLHPLDGYWYFPELYRAWHLADQGDAEQAAQLFDGLRHRPGLIGRAAVAGAMRARRQWAQFVDWVEKDLPASTLLRDMAVFGGYFRALGETGRIDRMLEMFAALPPLLHQPTLSTLRNMVRLFAFAFTGEPQRATSLLYGGGASAVPEATKQFWIATAEQTAGNYRAASARLDHIFPGASKSLQDAITDRRQHPLPVASLTAGARQLLEQADRDHRHELLYVRAAPDSRRTAVATWFLVGLNLIAFSIEMVRGGATNWEVLYRLGAAETISVQRGEWWRLAAANFLHAGWLHLTLNMAGLLVLGPFVERFFGRVRFLIVYLLAGMCGTGFVMIRSLQSGHEPEILVGASAAVMGLVGATGAILLVGWKRDRASSAMRRLRGIVAIIALQVVFDSYSPHVSGSAHLAGCTAGLLLALPLCLLRRPPRANSAATNVISETATPAEPSA